MKNLLILFLLLVCSLSAHAVTAFPEPQTITQPDGSTVTIVQHGDEWLNYITTEDGYTLLWDAQGQLVYAQLVDGELAPTNVVAHNSLSRSFQENAFLQTIGKGVMSETAEGRNITARKEARRNLSGKWDISKFRGLVILCNFNDKAFQQDYIFNDMLNKEGYTGYLDTIHNVQVECTGSVHDYFKDNSTGNFQPYFDVYGPITLTVSQQYPNQATNARSMFTAALKTLDSQIDYSKYDTNGDGTVDMVFFICAGGGSHAGNLSTYLWPHASTFSGVKLDGVSFGRYACSTELYGLEKYKKIDGIGTIVHEFSHVLGLPDLYDVDYATNGYSTNPGRWCIMAGGNYLNESKTPTGYGLYERWTMGWSNPEVISDKSIKKVLPLQTSNSGYRINSAIQNEYFLIENRRNVRWDSYLPGDGLCVWRVDSTDATKWTSNKVNNNPTHNYYELLRASEHDTTYVSSSKSYTLAKDGTWDCYPGSDAVDSLTNGKVKPYMNSWTGLKTEWTLKHITRTDDYITFRPTKDPINTYIETFESMPLTSGDTTGIVGNFSKWDMTKAIVCKPDSGWCDGMQAAGFLKGGEIHTTETVNYPVTTVKFTYYNPTSTASVVRCYTSTNGGLTWTNAKTFAGATYLRVDAGQTAEGEFQISSTEPIQFQFKLFSGSSTDYSYIDDIKISYDAPVEPEPLTGDINQDGKVDVSDVTTLTAHILDSSLVNVEIDDVNFDGKVDVTDLATLINIILGGS